MVILMKKIVQRKCTRSSENIKKCGLGADVLKVPKQLLLVFWMIKANWAVLDITLLDSVENCVPIMHSYKLASRDMCPDGRLVHVGDQVIGGKKLVMMGGPCAVENERVY